MIIASTTDDRSLLIFDPVEKAVAYCEGLDVEDGGWQFWNSFGVPLEARFSRPNVRSGRSVLNGTYTLEPAASMGRPALAPVLWEQVYLESNPHFASVDSLRAHLFSGGGVQHGAL